MQTQNNTHHQTKIANVQTSRKKHLIYTLNKVFIVLFFGFFISLSLVNENLFLQEILIITGIVSVLSLAKGATNNYPK
jgi:hypothetical protein